METGSETKQAKQSREKDPNMSRGRVKMYQSLWTELPAELLEQVLHFLQMPDLCRSRNVCKRWNTLICSPEFGKLCVLNASKSANEGGCLFVKLRVCSQTYRWREVPGCSMFDLNEKRWYNLKHDFRAKGYLDDVSAMDGFVCAFVDSFTEEQRRAPNCILYPRTHEHQTLVMYNPFGGASKVLPNPPLVDCTLHSLKLKLIVDNTCNTFKIFLIKTSSQTSNREPSVFIYESYTDQWRSPPNPPGYVDHILQSANLAIFEGLLYVLFKSQSNIVVLLSFNFKDNSWEDTGVQFPRDVWDHDLVVSDNRLFLFALLNVLEDGQEQSCEYSGPPLEISEILPAEKGCRTVVRMEASEMYRNFDSFSTHAFGFNKSILLMGNHSGKVMLYNLATGQWESLPQNPFEHMDPKLRYTDFVGTQMNYLRLPDTPW